MKPAIALTLARFYELLPAGEIRSWRAHLAGIAAPWRARLPDPRPARPRHLHHGRPVRRHGDVPCRAAAVDFRRTCGSHRRRRADRLLDAPWLPAQADRRLPRSGERSARRRLSHRPVEDRDRLGRNLGQGLPSWQPEPPDYLPEGHTDFAFASLAEEWGLVGGVALIIAFALLVRWDESQRPTAGHASPSFPPRG